MAAAAAAAAGAPLVTLSLSSRLLLLLSLHDLPGHAATSRTCCPSRASCQVLLPAGKPWFRYSDSNRQSALSSKKTHR